MFDYIDLVNLVLSDLVEFGKYLRDGHFEPSAIKQLAMIRGQEELPCERRRFRQLGKLSQSGGIAAYDLCGPKGRESSAQGLRP